MFKISELLQLELTTKSGNPAWMCPCTQCMHKGLLIKIAGNCLPKVVGEALGINVEGEKANVNPALRKIIPVARL